MKGLRNFGGLLNQSVEEPISETKSTHENYVDDILLPFVAKAK